MRERDAAAAVRDRRPGYGVDARRRRHRPRHVDAAQRFQPVHQRPQVAGPAVVAQRRAAAAAGGAPVAVGGRRGGQVGGAEHGGAAAARTQQDVADGRAWLDALGVQRTVAVGAGAQRRLLRCTGHAASSSSSSSSVAAGRQFATGDVRGQFHVYTNTSALSSATVDPSREAWPPAHQIRSHDFGRYINLYVCMYVYAAVAQMLRTFETKTFIIIIIIILLAQ